VTVVAFALAAFGAIDLYVDPAQRVLPRWVDVFIISAAVAYVAVNLIGRSDE